MDDRTKYVLIGLVIGILIGIIVFYLLMSFRIIQPLLFGGARTFERPGMLPGT